AVAVLEIASAFADRLHFGAGECDTTLDCLEQMVVMVGLPIGRHHFVIRHRVTSRIPLPLDPFVAAYVRRCITRRRILVRCISRRCILVRGSFVGGFSFSLAAPLSRHASDASRCSLCYSVREALLVGQKY